MFIQSSASAQSPSNSMVPFPPPAGQQFWGVSVGPVFWGKSLGGLSFDGSGLLGTGLFAGGMDLSTWTWAEWAAAFLGMYAVYQVFSGAKKDTQRVISGVRKIQRLPQEKRRRRAQRLRQEAKQIEDGL